MSSFVNTINIATLMNDLNINLPPQCHRLIDSTKLDHKNADTVSTPTAWFMPKALGGDECNLLAGLRLISQHVVNHPDVTKMLTELFQISGVQLPLTLLGSNFQKEKYLQPLAQGEKIAAHCLTERSGGTDVLVMQTTAKKVDNYWVLNGEKCFISNGPIADIGLVYARTDASAARALPQQLICLLVDMCQNGIDVSPPLNKLGLKDMPMSVIKFNEVKVPDENIVGGADRGFYTLQISTTLERIIIPAIFCVLMIKVFNMCMHETKRNSQAEVYLGGMYTEIMSAYHFICSLYKSIDLNKWHRDYIRLGCLIKIQLTETYLSVMKTAEKIATQFNFPNQALIHEEYKNALGAWIYSGTNDVLKSMLARIV